MIAAFTYDDILRSLSSSGRWEDVRVAGLLFARPHSALAKQEIVPHLEYYHHCSGRHVHFFCAGYGAYWPEGGSEYSDKIPVVTRVDDIPWQFSEQKFDQLRRELQLKTTWRYSGGADLLLMNVTADAEGRPALQFASAYCFQLDRMVRDSTIPSIETFFQTIFQFAEEYSDDDAVTAFFASPNLNESSAIPDNIRTLWQRAKATWDRMDYAGVLHACASILETMAKHLDGRSTVQNESLGGFFSGYRKRSSLSEGQLDRILDIYNQRNRTPLAGHGSMGTPGITFSEARDLMRFTSECVHHEYKARAQYVGFEAQRGITQIVPAPQV
jgi:hypothetical protein